MAAAFADITTLEDGDAVGSVMRQVIVAAEGPAARGRR